jgi:hypothetical protein
VAGLVSGAVYLAEPQAFEEALPSWMD